MAISKCEHCGIGFKAQKRRERMQRFCSRECSYEHQRIGESLTCPICGKLFHRKPSYIAKSKHPSKLTCSSECDKEIRRIRMSGENNHQYGLKGNLNSSFKGDEIKKRNHDCIEVRVYLPSHPFADRAGRVLKHRLVVETNYHLFEPKFFCSINGYVALKNNYEVHHIDGNHSNNEVSNLQVLTKSEHRSEHNKRRNQKRDKLTGRFIK